MSNIELIQKLRSQTGAGMGDCKKALDEANEDFEKAIEILRKKGAAKAAKKADRDAYEGLVAIAKAPGKISVVALNCETDFVARNEDFISAVQELADKFLTTPEDEFRVWADEKIKNELVVKIGENIQLGNLGVFEGAILGAYLHSNKRVAAVVELSRGPEELAVDLAMQVVAMKPEYLKPEDVPAEIIEKEKEIITEQLIKEGKPAEIIEKIMAGKLSKYYEDVCLLKQTFIKDDKLKVEDYIKKAGEGVGVVKFTHITL